MRAEAETGVRWPQAQVHMELPKAARGGKQVSSTAVRVGVSARPHLDLWHLASRMVRINFCRFESCWWEFVRATPGS